MNYLDEVKMELLSGEVIFAFLLPANNEELSSSLPQIKVIGQVMMTAIMNL